MKMVKANVIFLRTEQNGVELRVEWSPFWSRMDQKIGSVWSITALPMVFAKLGRVGAENV